MINNDDDALLDHLDGLFAADLRSEPSEAEVAQFLTLLDAGDSTSAGVVVPFNRGQRLRRRVAIGGIAAVVGLSGLTAVGAAANEGALPTPARIVAHGVGLPVDSVDLANARRALRQVRSSDDSDLPQAVAKAEHSLESLTSAERADISDADDRALEQARVAVSHRGPGGGKSTNSGPPPLDSTRPTQTATTITTPDHSGTGAGSDSTTIAPSSGSGSGSSGSGSGGSGSSGSGSGSSGSGSGGSGSSGSGSSGSGSSGSGSGGVESTGTTVESTAAGPSTTVPLVESGSSGSGSSGSGSSGSGSGATTTATTAPSSGSGKDGSGSGSTSTTSTTLSSSGSGKSLSVPKGE